MLAQQMTLFGAECVKNAFNRLFEAPSKAAFNRYSAAAGGASRSQVCMLTGARRVTGSYSYAIVTCTINHGHLDEPQVSLSSSNFKWPSTALKERRQLDLSHEKPSPSHMQKYCTTRMREITIIRAHRCCSITRPQFVDDDLLN